MNTVRRIEALPDKKHQVSIVKGPKHPNREQIHRMVFDSIELIGGVEGIIGNGDRVLIKPNAGSMSMARGAVTNPYVVEAVAAKAREAGAGEVIIGEAAQVGVDTKKVFELNGYYEVAKRAGARLLDLNDDEAIEVEIDGRLLRVVRVFRSALECDAVINVPVVKTHALAGITLGLKNMKGLIPAEEKRRFHMLGLDSAIADLQLAIRPSMTVVDGNTAMGGLGAPIHPSDAVELDLIIAGFNALAVDAVACRIIGFTPQDVNHLVYAMEHGLGSLDIEDVKIEGEIIERVQFNIEKPRFEFNEFDTYKNLKIVQKGACSGCVGALYSAINVCHKMEELPRLMKTTFLLGPLAEPPKFEGEKIIIGRCLQKIREKGNYVPGCPPLVIQIRDELRELIGLPRIGGKKQKFLEAAQSDEDIT